MNLIPIANSTKLILEGFQKATTFDELRQMADRTAKLILQNLNSTREEPVVYTKDEISIINSAFENHSLNKEKVRSETLFWILKNEFETTT